jgi:MFS family permease
VRQVSRDRSVLALLLLTSLSFFIAAALEVLGIAFAYQVLGAGDAASGLLIGAVGLGEIVGAALATGLAFRPRLAVPFVLGLMLAGLPLVVMVATRSLGGATTLLALCGLGQAFSTVAGRTLLQRTTDDAVLARVLAVQEGVMLIGLAAGAAAAPLLLQAFGEVGGFAALGVLLVVLALVSLPLVRGLDHRAVFRPDVLAALRRVAFLAAMAPPALDRLSHHAEWVDVAPDEVVVAQGDDGDAFFVVGSGVLSVTVDGALRDHRLEPGDGFGEIALLHGTVRTATVTSTEASRLLRIERDDFLAALTGSADGRDVAEGVAAAHLHRDDDLRAR